MDMIEFSNQIPAEHLAHIFKDFFEQHIVAYDVLKCIKFININEVTKQNKNFRTTLWTGQHLQITLMSINVGESIGLEMHPNLDQFIRIEQGFGLVQMGDNKNNLNFERKVCDDFAIVIPAGKWHNLINIGNLPIKLYSIYAPPQHPKGTIHRTKADAEH